MATYSGNPPPEEDPPVRCDYCGWPGVPPHNAEPPLAAINYPEINSPLVSPGTRSVEVSPGVGCPFCGSPMYQSGGRRRGKY